MLLLPLIFFGVIGIGSYIASLLDVSESRRGGIITISVLVALVLIAGFALYPIPVKPKSTYLYYAEKGSVKTFSSTGLYFGGQGGEFRNYHTIRDTAVFRDSFKVVVDARGSIDKAQAYYELEDRIGVSPLRWVAAEIRRKDTLSVPELREYISGVTVEGESPMRLHSVVNIASH